MSYRAQRRIERRPAKLIRYRGPRAMVSYHNGPVFTMPSAPLRKLSITPGDPFFLIVTWMGKEVHDVRAERPHPARLITPRGATPKIMVKTGRRVRTRKNAT